MSESIDLRINDLINEYLDYKGYTTTVDAFLKERQSRKEPISKITQSNLYEKEQEKNRALKEKLLKCFENGNREEFIQLWYQNIPSTVIDNDPSLKSLEFLIYAYFALYHLRPDVQNKNNRLAQENMLEFKTYIESIKGQGISQTSDILPLFALPYVAEPEKNPSFQEFFSENWRKQLHSRLLNFFEWVFASRPLPSLVDILQKGERAINILTLINNENEELKYRNRETNRHVRHISTDYCNLIGITMELVETLQQAVVGKTITNEYIDNVCARLGLARVHESIFHMVGTPRPGTNDSMSEKLDYGKIKRDIAHPSTNSRLKGLLLQALRWKLTKAKTDFQREKSLECYIGCDLIGCRSDTEQRTKIIRQLSSMLGGDSYYVKEEWARLINTIASLRKGRNYLAPNESLILCMQKAAMSESSDTLIKQHLLAALQKLSLKRSVQIILINQNIIKWLITLLSKPDRLSDYTLEYGVALLMNLCLRTSGRKKCASIAEQAITVLSALLTHPNQETRPYVNSSLYSILTLKPIREKALQLNLDNRLRSIIQTERANSETRGQLEFLLNLLHKGGDQDGRQTSDNEQDNDDEDQDIMEADLDLGDKLCAAEKELSGDRLIGSHYASQRAVNFQLTYSSSMVDPVLSRPITPGHLRQSKTSKRLDSFSNQMAVTDFHKSQFESDVFSNSVKQPASVSTTLTLQNGEDKEIIAAVTKSDSNNDLDQSISINPTPTPTKDFNGEHKRKPSIASTHPSTSSVSDSDNENADK